MEAFSSFFPLDDGKITFKLKTHPVQQFYARVAAISPDHFDGMQKQEQIC